jgi:ABC-2 type transport system ATP-binding protein
MNDDHKYLSLFEITKAYKDTIALDNISFDVMEGEVLGYIGPNGAGKTTTIRILVGLIRDFQGVYKLKNSSPDQLYKELGYLPQGVSFQEWRTVDSALNTLGRISGLDQSWLERQIESILLLLDLNEVRYRKVAELSGGMIQKLGLAQALLNKPKFLVLDEPLSGLDPTSRHEVKQVIKRLSDEGTTIFFSSHILSDVQDVADRIAIIDKGHVLKIDRTTDLTTDLVEGYVYEIESFDDFQDVSLFEAYDQIHHIEQPTPKRIRIHIRKDCDLKSLTTEVLRELVNRNCPIRNFTRIIPNLDDVYLKYVTKGKSP